MPPETEECIYNQAPELWSYLGGTNPSDPQKGHLKVMATIANDDGHIQWAIFFGNKGAKKDGDDDFKLTGFGEKPFWENTRPLWLIPMTEEAKKEGWKAAFEKRTPKILTRSIVIRNKQSYKFWYDNEREWNEDPVLHLAADSFLKSLSDKKGKWITLSWQAENTVAGDSCDDDSDIEQWPVWITTEKFATTDRIIEFQAPACHIVNDNGKYFDYQVWFGVREKNLSNQPVNFPFIAINETNLTYGSDCPIVWQKSKRLDDVLFCKGKQGKFEIKTFCGKPLECISFKSQNHPLANTVGNFSKNISQDCKAWILKEDDKFNVFYGRITVKNFSLFKASQSIGLIQISRDDNTHIFTQLKGIENVVNGNNSIWNTLTKRTADALKSNSSSAPVGVVPQILNEKIIDENLIYNTEWTCANTVNLVQCSATSYNLHQSCLLNENREEILADQKSTVKFPNINPNNTSWINSQGIRITNCSLSFNTAIDLVNDNGTIFQFLISEYHLEPPIILHDGAFTFTLNDSTWTKNSKTNNYGHCRLVATLAKSQRPFFLWQWYVGIDKVDKIVLGYSIQDFSLPVKKVESAGQDPLAKDKLLAPGSLGTAIEGFGERSEPPLIIPLNPSDSGNTEGQYLLTMSESINVGQNYRLDIRLQEFDPEANKDKSTQIKAVILDANPQMIGLVNARFLQQSSYDDGAWILARRSPFSEEAGGWEILDDSAETGGFHLILPSQGIGEAYVKGGKQNGDAIEPIDGEPKDRQPIDYRFGAPAILKLAAERLERRYVAPPWNLRRIWGQPGDAAPGIPFLESQFELLYGLIGYVKPDKAFIAELASKLGEVPVPPVNSIAWEPTKTQETVFAESWKRYLQFYRAWKSRLGILEPSVNDDFGNTTFDKNISFKPRINFSLNNEEVDKFFNDMKKDLTEHSNLTNEEKQELKEIIEKFKIDINSGVSYQTILDDKNIVLNFLKKINNSKYPSLLKKLSHLKKNGASLKYPITTASQESLSEDENDLGTLEEKIRLAHDKNGLAGGFHYGFESKAIYKEFWREAFTKGSSSGEIKGLAYSSVGGYGKQTARFASNKIIIRSISSMGRTHVYAVETIGRIGVFWHKAKHVIEYERTVVPSKQFKDDQPPHLGRPLVRKVREYIEILEPSRSYPDFTTGLQDAPGSVTACTFKSILIPVLSAWGHDVIRGRENIGTESEPNWQPISIGWEVPLWKPGADPEIYPKPQVLLSLLAPPDADEKAILQNLSEPQNLWFYTDTREFAIVDKAKIPVTAEVHAWPAIQEVDFTNLPEPEQYDIAPAAGDSPELIGQPMPDALDIMPGFERFTFRVDRNDIPSSIAGRYYSNAAITGRMRTVSMMRSSFDKTKKWISQNPTPQKALEDLLYKQGCLLEYSANGFSDLNNQVKNGIPIKIKDFEDKIKSFVNDSKCLATLQNISSGIEKPSLKYLDVITVDDASRSLWDEGRQFEYPTKWLWREVLSSSEGLINSTIGFYESQERIFLVELEIMASNSQQARDQAVSILHKFKDRVTTFRNNLEFGSDLLNTFKSEAIKNFDNVISQLSAATDSNAIELSLFLDSLDLTIDITIAKGQIKDKLKLKFESLKDEFKNVPEPWGSYIQQYTDKYLTFLNDWLQKSYDKVDVEHVSVNELIANVKTFLEGNIGGFKIESMEITNEIKTKINEYILKTQNDLKSINTFLTSAWDDIWKEFIKTLDTAFGQWENGEVIIMSTVKNNLSDIKERIAQLIKDKIVQVLFTGIFDQKISFFKILSSIDSIIKKIESKIVSSLIDFFANPNYKKWFNTLDSFQGLKNALQSSVLDKIIAASNVLANHVNLEFGRLVGEVAQKYRDTEKLVDDEDALIQTGKQTLNNFRSVWEEFTAPGMGLNRRTVAMIVKTDWKDVEQRLSITPCISKIKQFGEGLEGLGLRLPVVAITDRLLPSKAEWREMEKSLLSKFDFSNLFSDLGGMRFDKLFPGFKMPEFARDKLKITHSFDRKNASAWIKAEADIKLTDRKKLLSIGPVVVELENGQFTGEIKFDGELEGKLKRTNSGKLSGSWNINIAGTGLMIFRDTSIIFKDDKLTFDLDPSRMEMPGLLKMLTDATTKLTETGISGGTDENGDKKQAFKVGLVKVKERPVGIKAALDIPPISIGSGTTAITNLCFGGHFELKALDDHLKPNFLLGFGFYLGKKEAPFTVTIFILGGGGYIYCNLIFEPTKGLTVDFVMSIHASATLAIAAGWMTGFVSIMAGFEGEYHKTPALGGSVYVTIYVRVIGMVELLSVVSVFLFLSLEATYRTLGNGGNELVGVGFVQMEIRVCRFFKIKVAKSYSKRFAGSGSSGSSSNPPPALRANASTTTTPEEKAINILKSLA